MSWEPNGDGRWRKSPSSETAESIIDTSEEVPNGLGAVVAFGNYSTSTALNHQRHLYDSLDYNNLLSARLHDEFLATSKNFEIFSQRMSNHEKGLSDFQDTINKWFKKLEDDLQQRFGDVDKTQKSAADTVQQLRKEMREFKKKTDQEIASLESKHGELQQLLRNVSMKQFPPTERTVKEFK